MRISDWSSDVCSSDLHGFFHAGGTSALADTAGGYAGFTLFPQDSSVLTVEFKINLVAPARGDYLEAVGKVLRSGRTLTICQLEVHAVLNGKKELVAIGQQTLMRSEEHTSELQSLMRISYAVL